MTMFLICGGLLMALCLWMLLRPLMQTRGAPNQLPSDPKREALLRAHRDGVLSDVELADKLAALPVVEASAAISPNNERKPVATAAFTAMFLIVGTALLYGWIGNPKALDPANLARTENANAIEGSVNGEMPASLDAAIAQLETKMQANPDDVDGWMLLARSYRATARDAQALEAVRKAHALLPAQDDIATELAELIAAVDPNHKLDGEPTQLLDAVLTRNARHERALWLRGIADAQAGNAPGAIERWTQLLQVLPNTSEVRPSLIQEMQQLAQRAGIELPASITEAQSNNAPAGVGQTNANNTETSGVRTASNGTIQIQLKVDISPELQAKRTTGDVLYVFARLPEGPKMPLAIQRIESPQFPLQITLDETMGMMPELSLATAEKVVVGARLSASGIANAQSGDFESSTPLVELANPGGSKDLLIDSIRP